MRGEVREHRWHEAPGTTSSAGLHVTPPACPASSPQVRLGPGGVEEFLPIGPLSEYEQEGLAKMKELLQKNIATGIEFANK